MIRKREEPQIIKTDKFEIRIYRQAREVVFYRYEVRLLQLLPKASAAFRIRLKDFERYPQSLDAFVEFIKTWRPT